MSCRNVFFRLKKKLMLSSSILIRFLCPIAEMKVLSSTLWGSLVRFWFWDFHLGFSAPPTWTSPLSFFKSGRILDQIKYVWYLSPKIAEIVMKFQSASDIFMQEHRYSLTTTNAQLFRTDNGRSNMIISLIAAHEPSLLRKKHDT